MSRIKHCILLLVSLLMISNSFSYAAGPSIEEAGVSKILARRCLSCHNDADRKGDFSLQSKESFEEASLTDPGDPDASYLLDLLTSKPGQAAQMPKDADPLKQSEIETIRDWIQQGAHWSPNYKIEESVVDDFDWWSFQPLQRPNVPKLTANTSAAWQQNPIDAFILRKQTEKELTHSAPAERRILIRRLTYDLTGLPPTLEEIDEFLNDKSAQAYLNLVDRLLDSSAYGEHWARHWLDVVKYADTCGYDKDKLRENAWPYRDYIVRSFNTDKPYSQFIQEQIAGDVLYPGQPDGILGLGFIAAGPWDFIGHVEVSEAKLDGKVARNLDRDDMVSNVINTFCSVTIQCARCHNHKFDPFTQEHYYSLQSVFSAVDRAERAYDLDPKIEQERRDVDTQLAAAKAKESQLKKELAEAGGDLLKQLNSEITSLTQLVQPSKKKPEFGYHSQIAKVAETSKWVQIDLGAATEVGELVLHACHDDYGGIGAGFGFPIRYKIEGVLSAQDFNDPQQPVFLIDNTEQPVANPGLQPVRINVGEENADGKLVRYIRITATKLAERKNDYIFALAEVEAFDQAGKNVALQSMVTALDSIEAPPRWGRSNLTDGIWAFADNPEAEEKLALLTQQRTDLLKEIETPERQKKQADLKDQITKLQNRLSKLPAGKMVYAAATHFKPRGNFKPTQGTPRPIHLLHRGNIGQPKQLVSPGVLPFIQNEDWQLALNEQHSESDRRAALAKWVSNKNHPLTWRSIVNRVWLYHFGEGLVASLNDFGRMGQLPSHPELLDWLAVEFRDGGQSFKKLHRLIVTSATYQQASSHHPNHAAIDSSNRLLWRMNRRRLSAEEIRDTILSVSDQLDRTAGGPGDRLFVLEHPQHSPHYEYHLFDPTAVERHRRSIYRFVVRSQPDPWMSVLDCADSSQSTPKRSETLTALQALSLMNNKFNLVMAERFATRLSKETTEPAEQIKLGFRLTTGRFPTSDETTMFVEYTNQYGLKNSCRLLLNLSEFVFID